MRLVDLFEMRDVRIVRADREDIQVIPNGGVDKEGSFVVVGVNGKAYNVEVKRDEITSCSCPDFKYRGQEKKIPCKHMIKVSQSEWLPINIPTVEQEARGKEPVDSIQQLKRELKEEIIASVLSSLSGLSA